MKQLLMLAILVALQAAAEPVAVKPLPLVEHAAASYHEYSGLDWWGDYLVLLPEDPDALTLLRRDDLAKAIASDDPQPLRDSALPIAEPDRFRDTPCFDGLEAIAIRGNDVWVVTENRCVCEMSAYLLHGKIDPERHLLEWDDRGPVEVPMTHQRCNMGRESLLLTPESILVFEESNGANLIAHPTAAAYSLRLERREPIALPAVEYRVTDATALDSKNRFWMINYLWPPERRLLDPAVDAFDPDATEPVARATKVERLLEFELTDEGIVPTLATPVDLGPEGAPARNWEGLVRWDEHSFLILTDEHPETMLGYVAP